MVVHGRQVQQLLLGVELNSTDLFAKAAIIDQDVCALVKSHISSSLGIKQAIQSH